MVYFVITTKTTILKTPLGSKNTPQKRLPNFLVSILFLFLVVKEAFCTPLIFKSFSQPCANFRPIVCSILCGSCFALSKRGEWPGGVGVFSNF